MAEAAARFYLPTSVRTPPLTLHRCFQDCHAPMQGLGNPRNNFVHRFLHDIVQSLSHTFFPHVRIAAFVCTQAQYILHNIVVFPIFRSLLVGVHGATTTSDISVPSPFLNTAMLSSATAKKVSAAVSVSGIVTGLPTCLRLEPRTLLRSIFLCSPYNSDQNATRANHKRMARN